MKQEIQDKESKTWNSKLIKNIESIQGIPNQDSKARNQNYEHQE